MTIQEFTDELEARKHDDRYSENLLKFMRKFRKRTFRAEQLDVCANTEGWLYIGTLERNDEHWNGTLIGMRLNRALTTGSARDVGCIVGTVFTEIGDWIRLYLELGKCHLDPNHYSYSERWNTEGDERTCKWCGLKQHLVKTIVTVEEEKWQAINSEEGK